MNQISSRFSVCFRSSSLFRENPFARSSKPISSSSSSSKLILHHHTFNYPYAPAQIPGNHHFRKFSGEASQCNSGDDDYLKNEISDIDMEYYGDMTEAYVEFVDAGGERCRHPFMSHYRRMLTGEGNGRFDILREGEDESADEEYQKILASLWQMKVRSRLMRKLIEEKSDSQSTVA